MKDFEERESHSAADDHLIHFVQQILNQQDLVRHLRTDRQTTNRQTDRATEKCVAVGRISDSTDTQKNGDFLTELC